LRYLIDALKAEDQSEQQKPWPQEEDTVYTPVGKFAYVGGITDIAFYFSGMLHKNANDRNKHRQIIRRMVELRGGWVPDWDRPEQNKWYLYWYHPSNEPTVSGGAISQHQGTFYLPSKQACQTLIDEFGDDLRVLFGMSLED
jgi:hypothetical protein